MRRRTLYALFIVAALSLGAAREASAQHVHMVEEGETIASIAQLYYGDPKRARVLRSENAVFFEEGQQLLPGMRLQIPHVVFHTVNEGEGWADLAVRYYGTSRRAEALRQLNRGELEGPRAGEELMVPPLLIHRAPGNETVLRIARSIYGNRKGAAELIRLLNAELPARPEKGALIFYAAIDLRLSNEGLERVSARSPQESVEGGTRERQQLIAREFPELSSLIRSGHYVEALALGNRLLGVGELTEIQALTIHRHLAIAYIAMERDDLAINAYLSALELEPQLELDSLRTSPKVQRVFKLARELFQEREEIGAEEN